MGMWAEIGVIIQSMFIGLIIDTVGRKGAIIVAVFSFGIATGLIPFFTSVYPGFFICRIVMSLGSVIGIYIPLLPDYV